MVETDSLQSFGQEYVRQLRDGSLAWLDAVMSGRMKGARCERLYASIADFSPQQREALRTLCAHLTDHVLHETLNFFEQSERWRLADEAGENLAELSDGLCGELYGEDGWIEKFSGYPASLK